ncbi:MAG: hypothetical protein AABX04_02110, partial [Nanoarchaeota archaeon]
PNTFNSSSLYVKNSVTGLKNGTSAIVNDSCSSNYDSVIEVYCSNLVNISWNGWTCPTSTHCRDGACVENNCSDKIDNDQDGLIDCDDPDCDKKVDCGYLDLSCTPQCLDKECGPNGCGGSCGPCGNDKICNSSQKCTSCPMGLSSCSSSCVNFSNNQYHCGNCTTICFGGKICKEGKCSCAPKCNNADGTTKQCGDDGCGGTCGACKSEETCESGVCKSNQVTPQSLANCTNSDNDGYPVNPPCMNGTEKLDKAPDCNDSDSKIWMEQSLYQDYDKDTFGNYFATPETKCTNGTLPSGYSLNHDDCFDKLSNQTSCPTNLKCVSEGQCGAKCDDCSPGTYCSGNSLYTCKALDTAGCNRLTFDSCYGKCVTEKFVSSSFCSSNSDCNTGEHCQNSDCKALPPEGISIAIINSQSQVAIESSNKIVVEDTNYAITIKILSDKDLSENHLVLVTILYDNEGAPNKTIEKYWVIKPVLKAGELETVSLNHKVQPKAYGTMRVIAQVWDFWSAHPLDLLQPKEEPYAIS